MAELTDKTGAPVDVRLTDKGDAYAIYVDDSAERAGATFFIDHGDDRIFYHTEVGEEYGGRGLAGVLVENALADTREQKKTVVPVCPYVHGWLGKHDWDGSHREPTEEDRALVKERTSGGSK